MKNRSGFDEQKEISILKKNGILKYLETMGQ